MGRDANDISIHAKKYFKVVLDGIDPAVETPESFALKLSTRTRVTVPRVRALTSRMPCTVKGHLSAAQANRLKDLLEEIGGVVRIEAHLVTPASAGGAAPRPAVSVVWRGGGEAAVACPECGWEAEAGATHCSLCLRRFRDPASRTAGLEDRVPEKNPLDPDWEPPSARGGGGLRRAAPYVLVVVLGTAAAFAVFFLTK